MHVKERQIHENLSRASRRLYRFAFRLLPFI
jgi:hypothetical protein